MHEFKRDQRHPSNAKSHADFLTLATLRYEIHAAVSCIDNEDDLRTILSRVRRMKPQREEPDDD